MLSSNIFWTSAFGDTQNYTSASFSIFTGPKWKLIWAIRFEDVEKEICCNLKVYPKKFKGPLNNETLSGIREFIVISFLANEYLFINKNKKERVFFYSFSSILLDLSSFEQYSINILLNNSIKQSFVYT